MDQKKLGRLQIEIGWILLVLTITAGIVGYFLIFDVLTLGFSEMVGTWESISEKQTVNSDLIEGQIVSFSVLSGLVAKVGLILFSLLILMLIGVSFILITQGASNSYSNKTMSYGVEESKKKFKKVFSVCFTSFLFISLSFFVYSGVKVLNEEIINYLSFGFPQEYMTLADGKIEHFNIIGFLLDIIVSAFVSLGIATIYYRYILGIKKI